MRISPSVVIFDYGNVLCQSQPAADTQAMASILDLSVPRFTEIYWQFRVAYDDASLDPCTYWTTVARTASRELAPPQIDALVEIDSRSWSHPVPLVPQWARELRASGLGTALLSNMPAPVRDYVLRCAWLPEFDAHTFSCDVRICKPDPEIYHDCLTKLGAKASEVLFLDDREPNVRAAEALGWHGVHFTDAAHAAGEIERRFSLPVTLG